METLTSQFNDALTAIEVSGKKRDRVIAAHEEIRELLEADQQLCELGVDTILIGSYARRTGIYPGKDVDVFVKLAKLDTSADPATVFAAVERVLTAAYGDRAEPQRRSVKINFGSDGFSVDAVPAVKLRARWALPNHDPDQWGNPDERWIETDPETMGTLTEERNRSPKVGDRGAYVPTVKLVRQARRQHLGDDKPGGLYFEILTYGVFKDGATKGASFAEIFASTVREIATRLASDTPLINPALDKPYEPQPSDADRSAAAKAFDVLAAKAERALKAERCPAAVLWREIIGRNDRGECFPLPPGCDATGKAISSITGVSARGPREAHGFG
jgi:Second Messenger Oligonucleotide or Dinucleotide Synthetase domain